MHPLTHALASWGVADASGLEGRDRRLAAWCGILPDLDGLGLAADLARESVGLPARWLYGDWHHFVLHGLLGAAALPLVVAPLAARKLRVWAWGFALVHLHVLLDLVGSRGPDPDDVWPVHYLGPFSREPVWSWSGQWPLNAWPNVALTALLLAWGLVRAARAGRSPAELAGVRLDAAVVAAIRARWRSVRKR